jgi:hypothetical protein
MKVSRFLRRLIAGDEPGNSGAASLRNAVVRIFIALVALFLTEQRGLFDGPLPLPPERGLESRLFSVIAPRCCSQERILLHQPPRLSGCIGSGTDSSSTGSRRQAPYGLLNSESAP